MDDDVCDADSVADIGSGLAEKDPVSGTGS